MIADFWRHEYRKYILLFVVAVALYIVDIFWGFWDHDSGFYFLQSDFIAQGLRPYLDYKVLYPPLFLAINSLFIVVGISRGVLVWLTPLSWMLACSYLTFQCFKRGGGAVKHGWVLTALFVFFCIEYGGNHNTLEFGIIFFGLLAIWFQQSEMTLKYFFIGVCIGCATLVKQVGILFLIPMLVGAAGIFNILLLLLGIFVAGFVCLAWLDFKVFEIVESVRLLATYVQTTSSGTLLDKILWIPELLRREIFRSPPGVLLISFTLYISYKLLRRAPGESWHKNFLLGTWIFVFVAYVGARVINNFPHYTLNMWPAFVVIWIAYFKMTHGKFEFSLNSKVAKRIFVFVLLLCLFARDVGSRPYLLRWFHSSQLLTVLYPFGEEIKRKTKPGDRIAMAGFEESLLIFLAERLPQTRDWTPYLYFPEGQGLGEYVLLNDKDVDESFGKYENSLIEKGYCASLKSETKVGGRILLYGKSPAQCL